MVDFETVNYKFLLVVNTNLRTKKKSKIKCWEKVEVGEQIVQLIMRYPQDWKTCRFSWNEESTI